MILNFLIYFILGVMWAEWLEKFTTRNLSGIMAQPFKPLEKILHILLWPVFLLIFLYNFFEEIFKQ